MCKEKPHSLLCSARADPAHQGVLGDVATALLEQSRGLRQRKDVRAASRPGSARVCMGREGRVKPSVRRASGTSGHCSGHEREGRLHGCVESSAVPRSCGWALGMGIPQAHGSGPHPPLPLCPRRRSGMHGGGRREPQPPVRRPPSRPCWRMRRWRHRA